ncbi:unnamed protein product [Ostreobium quekettii]|uniref:Uncharacterized protein n=1 Tax=Ostreobium quekettii TaxID=121088 RepID=A0A8S1IWY6_9CHLO|nr:unnamed protein product [Ostreobium quekettii]
MMCMPYNNNSGWYPHCPVLCDRSLVHRSRSRARCTAEAGQSPDAWAGIGGQNCPRSCDECLDCGHLLSQEADITLRNVGTLCGLVTPTTIWCPAPPCTFMLVDTGPAPPLASLEYVYLAASHELNGADIAQSLNFGWVSSRYKLGDWRNANEKTSYSSRQRLHLRPASFMGRS